MDAKDELIKARVQMQNESPFFSYLVMHLRMIEDKANSLGGGFGVPTCGVDAYGNLYYNSDFIKKLSQAQIKGVLCHEILHLAFEHIVRESGREHSIWNIAIDLVSNEILIANKFELPEGCLIPRDHSFNIGTKVITDIDKKLAEEVYNELMSMVKKVNVDVISEMNKGQFDNHIFGKGSCKGDDGDDNKKGNSTSDKGIGGKPPDWKKVLAEAATIAKQRGNIPAGMERLIGELLNPKVSWKEMLYKYITREIPHDYTYCLDEDTPVMTKRGYRKLKNIRAGNVILGYKNRKIVDNKVVNTISSRVFEKYILYTSSGKRIICSGNHKILTTDGYKKAKDLSIGNIVLTVQDYAKRSV